MIDITITTIEGPKEEITLATFLGTWGCFCSNDAVKDVATAVTIATTSDENAFLIFLSKLMKFLPRLKKASYKKLIERSALKQSSVNRVQLDSKLARLKIDARDRNSDVQIPVQL